MGELAAEQAFSFRSPEQPMRPKIRPRVYEPEPTLVHPITRRKIPRPAGALAPPTPSMTFAPPPSQPSVPSMSRVEPVAPVAPWPSGPMDYGTPFYRGAPSAMRSEPPPAVSYTTPPPQRAIVSRTLVLKSRPTAWWAMALVVFGMSVGFIFTVLSNKSADPVDTARASTDAPNAAPPPTQPPQPQPLQVQAQQPQPVSVPVMEPPPRVPVAPSVPATTAPPPAKVIPPPPAFARPVVRAPPKPVAPATRVVKPVAPPPAPVAPKRPSGKDDDDLARARKETSTTL